MPIVHSNDTKSTKTKIVKLKYTYLKNGKMAQQQKWYKAHIGKNKYLITKKVIYLIKISIYLKTETC